MYSIFSESDIELLDNIFTTHLDDLITAGSIKEVIWDYDKIKATFYSLSTFYKRAIKILLESGINYNKKLELKISIINLKS